jgi:hypothetical protein
MVRKQIPQNKEFPLWRRSGLAFRDGVSFVAYYFARRFPGARGACRIGGGSRLTYAHQNYGAVALGKAQFALKLAVQRVYGSGIDTGTKSQGLGRQVYAFRRKGAVKNFPAVCFSVAGSGNDDEHIPLCDIGNNAPGKILVPHHGKMPALAVARAGGPYTGLYNAVKVRPGHRSRREVSRRIVVQYGAERRIVLGKNSRGKEKKRATEKR